MQTTFTGQTRVIRVLALALLFPVLSVATSLSQTPMMVTSPPGGNQPPVVSNLTVYQVPNKRVVVSGTVSDERPSGCTVTIGGVGAGSTTVSATGSFSVTVPVSGVGQLTATANDGQVAGQAANIQVTNSAPVIGNFKAVAGDGGSWTFSGVVGDEAPGGLTVVLTGFPGGGTQSALVGANGAFSITVTPPTNSSATITATVTDWFGLTASSSTIYGS